MEKYQNKYRKPSVRAYWWDYGRNGLYFVTICTQNRFHFFGEIVEARFIATPIGEIAQTIWLEIPNQFNYVRLGEFIVMPNHIHGIIMIDHAHVEARFIASATEEVNASPVETRFIASSPGEGDLSNAESRLIAPLPGGFAQDKNPMLNDNLSRIIRWYKGRTTFESRKIHADFAWQTRFYDHIIRNDTEHEKISNYIVSNPEKWENDKFYDPL
jgi:putative transposase